jgi:periplasmic protein TonB
MAHADTRPHALIRWPEFLRWSACAAVVLAAHGLLALAVLTHADEAELESGAPVVMVELAPLAVAPLAPKDELEPGPQQMQSVSQEAVAQQEKPQEKRVEQERMPEDTAPNPTVTLPPHTPEPPKEVPQAQAQQEPREAAPVPTAPPSVEAPAPRPAGPAEGRVPQNTAVILSWQRSLLAQLQRHTRYPPQAGHAQGVAKVTFKIDRSGHVVSSRIIQSSGSAVLDDEALATITRAQPLPRPPADVPDDQLAFINVPIHYGAR